MTLLCLPFILSGLILFVMLRPFQRRKQPISSGSRDQNLSQALILSSDVEEVEADNTFGNNSVDGTLHDANHKSQMSLEDNKDIHNVAAEYKTTEQVPSINSKSVTEMSISRIPATSPLGCSLTNGQFQATFADATLLGVGGFGAVYKAKHRLESGWYAVKLIPLEDLEHSEAVSARRDFCEVSNLRRLADTKHVVRYFTCWCEEPTSLPSDIAGAGGLLRKAKEAAPPVPVPRQIRRCHSLDSNDTSHRSHLSDRFCNKANTLDDPNFALPSIAGSSDVGYQASSDYNDSGVCFEESREGEVVVEKADASQRSSVSTSNSGPMLQLEKFQAVLMIQMELCTGPALRLWLDSARRRGKDASLNYTRSRKGEVLELSFAKQLMKGIREIHAADMVHRDVKPQNLFVQDDDVLKIGDFGLSRRGSDSRDGEKGKVGTPAYCAPEGGANAGAPADIFSAGLVILELLCPPFNTFMERAQVLEALRERGDVPEHIRLNLPHHARLLRRMVSREPENRPTAGEVHAELKRLNASGGLSPILEASLPPKLDMTP